MTTVAVRTNTIEKTIAINLAIQAFSPCMTALLVLSEGNPKEISFAIQPTGSLPG
jgi:hypothetical protein